MDAITRPTKGYNMSNLLYLVATEEGELVTFLSLKEAKKYAIKEGIYFVRRFERDGMGEIEPLKIKKTTGKQNVQKK